jgi:hypothetical protein
MFQNQNIPFQLKNETLTGTKLITRYDMFKMSIIEPFRATMYITRASPFSVQRLGTESFVTVE